MSRPSVPHEEKKREGEMLRSFFIQYQNTVEPSLTQEKIIDEMGLKSQGLFSQWTSGRTRISDTSLIWLSKRLKFDPILIRPSLKKYLNQDLSLKERQILERYRSDPSFHHAVDAIAEMSPFYLRQDKEADQ